MSRKAIKIPQAKQNAPIETQQLRVAAYCRVSTRHEEQYADRLSIRFKDGTEIEQIIECVGRASA